MGAAQSTRKITLVDDDKAGVIKLSESLAHRLRGQLEGQQAAAAARASPAAAQEPLHSTPPPPPQAPLPPPPQPSFIEKPLPIVPETPRIPEVAPLPEPPKVPDVIPVPKVPEVVLIPVVPEPVLPEPPEPSSSAEVPREVISEPLVPEPPPSLAAPLPATGEVKLIPLPQVLPIPQVKEAAPIPPPVVEAPAAPDVGVAIKAGPGPTLAQPAGSIPPWSIYAEEAHLMVMRLREEKDQEIKKLNLEWRDRVDVREKEFVKMAKLSEEQVEAALKEVESLFVKASCNPVCQNQQEAVMGCYQDHPRQSLRCAREVEHFTQCVDLSRLQSIMKQEAH